VIKLNIRGDKELRRNLAVLRNVFANELDVALKSEAQDILNDARENLVPMSDKEGHAGTLRNSGKVAYERRGIGYYAGISFGGAGSGAEAYTLAVHEEPPSEHHPPSWVAKFERGEQLDWTTPGTGHKFLQRAVDAAAETMVARISDRIRAVVAR
jgi:hypothetical protein